MESVADFFSKSLVTLSNPELLTGRGPHAHIGLHIFLAAALRAKPEMLTVESFQRAMLNLLPLKLSTSASKSKSKAKSKSKMASAWGSSGNGVVVVLDQTPGNSTRAQAQVQ